MQPMPCRAMHKHAGPRASFRQRRAAGPGCGARRSAPAGRAASTAPPSGATRASPAAQTRAPTHLSTQCVRQLPYPLRPLMQCGPTKNSLEPASCKALVCMAPQPLVVLDVLMGYDKYARLGRRWRPPSQTAHTAAAGSAAAATRSAQMPGSRCMHTSTQPHRTGFGLERLHPTASLWWSAHSSVFVNPVRMHSQAGPETTCIPGISTSLLHHQA